MLSLPKHRTMNGSATHFVMRSQWIEGAACVAAPTLSRGYRTFFIAPVAYHDSLADAVANLGQPEEIGQVFSGFQKYLYRLQTIT